MMMLSQSSRQFLSRSVLGAINSSSSASHAPLRAAAASAPRACFSTQHQHAHDANTDADIAATASYTPEEVANMTLPEWAEVRCL
jgi:hypothetical protein